MDKSAFLCDSHLRLYEPDREIGVIDYFVFRFESGHLAKKSAAGVSIGQPNRKESGDKGGNQSDDESIHWFSFIIGFSSGISCGFLLGQSIFTRNPREGNGKERQP